jgi:hypothetical protein
LQCIPTAKLVLCFETLNLIWTVFIEVTDGNISHFSTTADGQNIVKPVVCITCVIPGLNASWNTLLFLEVLLLTADKHDNAFRYAASTLFVLFYTTTGEKSFYRTYIAKPEAYSLNNMRTDRC